MNQPLPHAQRETTFSPQTRNDGTEPLGTCGFGTHGNMPFNQFGLGKASTQYVGAAVCPAAGPSKARHCASLYIMCVQNSHQRNDCPSLPPLELQVYHRYKEMLRGFSTNVDAWAAFYKCGGWVVRGGSGGFAIGYLWQQLGLYCPNVASEWAMLHAADACQQQDATRDNRQHRVTEARCRVSGDFHGWVCPLRD